jgi:hypothetical protein
MFGNSANPARVAEPPGVIIVIDPVEPEAGMAVISASETMVYEVAGLFPKLTAVAPVKWRPWMVIVVPAIADAGLKELMVGAGRKEKPGSCAEPVGVPTNTLPVAPVPIVAVITASETTVKDAAGEPPKVTDVAPDRLAPLMVIKVPAAAVLGEKEERVTGG